MPASRRPLTGHRNSLKNARSPDRHGLPSTGLRCPLPSAFRLLQLPNPLEDPPGYRVPHACHLYRRVQATPPFHHPRHASRRSPPCPRMSVAVRLRRVALPQGPIPRLPTSARPHRLQPSPTGSPIWCISREGPIPHLSSTFPLTPSPSAQSFGALQNGPIPRLHFIRTPTPPPVF